MAAAGNALDRGRERYASRGWMDAYQALGEADQVTPLAAADLELLATSAYMIGREGEYLSILERIYGAHLEADRTAVALRAAFWLGVSLMQRGEGGQAGGWLARADRLLDRLGKECVEAGYLQLPIALEHEARGDFGPAAAAAAEAVAAGERFGDRDLFSLAAHVQGNILVGAGRIGEGLRLLDEAMIAATSGGLSPIVTGIVYCGVILGCRQAQDLRRAREWTATLTQWCEQQPDIVAFTGRCLIHRAEIMQLDGAPDEALAEARRAAERCTQGENPGGTAEARYREGEIQRQLGETTAAEQAFREASGAGRDPQPGLALLRLAQGDLEAATTSIRRAAGEASVPARQVELLPAYVEIMLAAEQLEAARDVGARLEQLAAGSDLDAIRARAALCRGAIGLASGDPEGALGDLREAERIWQSLACPYEVARVRELVGRACEALGDRDTAALELEAARKGFESVGARTDLDRVEGRSRRMSGAHGLTARELQVLRLLSSGESNRGIAAQLMISERTVERHVSNIFVKLGVSSRAAATAYAYEHGLT